MINKHKIEDARLRSIIVMEELIKVAKHCIYIQSLDLDYMLYTENVIDLLERAACRGCKVKIAVVKPREDISVCFDLDFPLFDIKYNTCVYEYDFMLIDDTRFRLETNKFKYHAFACANNPETGLNMKTIFENGFGLETRKQHVMEKKGSYDNNSFSIVNELYGFLIVLILIVFFVLLIGVIC